MKILSATLKNRLKAATSDDSGAALITALLIMVVLTILGTSGIMTSTTDVKISANFKNYTESFYAADGGAEIARGIIELSLANGTTTMPDTSVITGGTDFYTQLIGPAFIIGGADPSDSANVDFTTTLANQSIAIDIVLYNRRVCAGGSSGVTGGEPVGGGKTGGVCSYYNIGSLASYRQSVSSLTTNYICRLGEAGCL